MLGFVFISLLAFGSAQDLIQDVPDGMTADELRDVLVDEMNKLRRAVHHGPPSNMNYMHWSKDLEKDAMAWAKGCPWKHGGKFVAQNMAWFTWPPKEETLRARAKIFWNECNKPGYDYWKGKPVSGGWATTGHYTNQDGATNLHVGCGFAHCEGKVSTLVCNYDYMPSKADVGDFVEKKYLLSNGTKRLYEIGPPCTGCRSGTGWCYKGLCVDSCPQGSSKTDCVCGLKDQCIHGSLDPDTCQCQCDKTHTGHLCDRPCQNFGSQCNSDSCKDAAKARTECAANCKKCQCTDQKCVNGDYDPSPKVCGCVCSGGWTGPLCDVCNKEACEQGGKWDEKTCSCECPEPYRGKTCQYNCDLSKKPSEFPCTLWDPSATKGVAVCSNSWFANRCMYNCKPPCKAKYLEKCSGLKEIPKCEQGTKFKQASCKCE